MTPIILNYLNYLWTEFYAMTRRRNAPIFAIEKADLILLFSTVGRTGVF